MKHPISGKGFSLVELMIAVTIVAVIVGLALPSYSNYVRKASRGEAQQLLLNWANNQEIWRAAHSSYSDGAVQADGTQLSAPTHAKYDFFVRATASNPPVVGDCANVAPAGNTYVLIACPKGDQLNDKNKGVSCNPLSLNQSNGKAPVMCW